MEQDEKEIKELESIGFGAALSNAQTIQKKKYTAIFSKTNLKINNE